VPEIALQAVNLAFAYPGNQQALRNLSLSVRKGQRLALLGANGVGKTTLLLHLNGTLKPQAGRVEVDGVPADYGRKGLLAWRQKVGLVFQDPDDQLFAATVAQDVSFGPINLGLPNDEVRHRVQESLKALDISDLAQRPTHMLSFGQKKLAAIAGVLAMRPSVMVLDEPTSGLDFHAAGQFLETIDRLHRMGTTLVLATHDIDLAYAWADEVALLREGSVARQGIPREVLRDKDLLAQCHLRMPWALEVALGLQQWAGAVEPVVLPRTQSELLSFCQRLNRRD
jgi:cobalt/nickel transport system ATP-binding protein